MVVSILTLLFRCVRRWDHLVLVHVLVLIQTIHSLVLVLDFLDHAIQALNLAQSRPNRRPRPRQSLLTWPVRPDPWCRLNDLT